MGDTGGGWGGSVCVETDANPSASPPSEDRETDGQAWLANQLQCGRECSPNCRGQYGVFRETSEVGVGLQEADDRTQESCPHTLAHKCTHTGAVLWIGFRWGSGNGSPNPQAQLRAGRVEN